MTTHTWRGVNGAFFNPANWGPAGAPQEGDTAVITSGFAWASNANVPDTLHLGSQGQGGGPTLWLFNGTLGNVVTAYSNGPAYAQIDVNGVTTLRSGADVLVGDQYGVSSAAGSTGALAIDIADNSVFINHGALAVAPGSELLVLGSRFTQFVNSGQVVDDGGLTVVHPDVLGKGFMEVQSTAGDQATLVLQGSVSAGQDVDVSLFGNAFKLGFAPGGTLTLTQPMRFGGLIQIGAGGDVFLQGAHETAFSYSTADVLDVWDHTTLIAALHIGNHAGSGFDLNNTPLGVDITPRVSAALPLYHHA